MVSDSEAVEFISTKHQVANGYEDAVAQAVNAGLNIRTHFTPPADFILPLRSAVRKEKSPKKHSTNVLPRFYA